MPAIPGAGPVLGDAVYCAISHFLHTCCIIHAWSMRKVYICILGNGCNTCMQLMHSGLVCEQAACNCLLNCTTFTCTYVCSYHDTNVYVHSVTHAIIGTVGMVVHKYILYTPLLLVVPSSECSAAEAIQLLLNGLQLVQRREKHTAHTYSVAYSTPQNFCSAHLFTPYVGF